MRAAPLLTLLVLACAVAVQAVPGLRQDVDSTTGAMTPVVTLAAGTSGTTTLGVSKASAVTTGVALPATGSVQVLKVMRGSSAWTVELVGLGIIGAGANDNINLVMVGGTTQTQVVVTNGVITKAVGTPVTIPASGSGSDVQIRASGTCAGSCYFGLWVAIRPVGLATPVMAYLYELTVT